MGTTPEGKLPFGTRSKSRFSTTRSRRPSGSSEARRRNQGCSRASVVRTFSRMPVLLPFSLLRSTGCRRARPAAHHPEGVAHPDEGGLVGPGHGVEERGRRAPPRRGPRGCPGSTRRRRRSAGGRCGPGPPCPGRAENRRPGASGTMPDRRTSKERARMRRPVPASGSSRSQPASSTAWTSESWPRFGQPWFMSRIGNVDHQGVEGGHVRRLLHPHVVEDPAGHRGRAVGHAELPAVADLVLAGNRHRPAV